MSWILPTISLFLGLFFGHGVVMLIILGNYRREDVLLYGGRDLLPGWWLAYWIATPLSLAGIVACSAVAL